MTKRTRLFLLISIGVLVLGLGTGLLASYVGFQGLTIVGSDGPDELAYVPQDSRLVAFANVRDVMNSDFRHKLQALQPDSAARTSDFQARTGVNIESDVDTVVVSLGAATEMGPPLVIARGRFDAVRIEGLMREQGGEVEEYKGKRLVTVAGAEHPFGVAFVEPGLLAFGTADAVRSAIDTKSGASANITTNTELMKIVRDIDDGNAWAVGRFDAFAASGRIPKEVAGQIPPITWFAAMGHIDSGVEGLLRAETSNDQAANDLREVIRGFMALARLQTRQNPGISAMLDSLRLGGEGKTVSVGFSVPPEMVDVLAAMQGRGRGAGPRAPRGPRPGRI
ncbi:MAG: hypothetical protein Q7J25_08895 [Vicinamibacterales bacterium]|nr:hypothetical protein [Vicinamibacterales bacterium]